MLDPDLTNILNRRIGASLIDIGLIGLITTAVWRTQLIAFPITSTDAITGEAIFDAPQRARQAEIATKLNTSFTRGNTLYVLDQSGFVLTALCAIVLFALVFILIPANTGWSPGKKLLGLGVVDADGENPSLLAYVKRTALGIVDLIPVVLPGLVGWVLANGHEYRQRLGDRFAGTYVIDNRVGAKFIDPSVYERRQELRRASMAAPVAHDADDMVQIDDRLSNSPSGLHRDEPEIGIETDSPDLPALASPAVDAEIDLSRLAPDANTDDLDRPSGAVPPIDLSRNIDPPRNDAPLPSSRFSVDAHPPTNELGFVETDQPELGLTHSPMPLDATAPDEQPTPIAAAPPLTSPTPDTAAEQAVTPEPAPLSEMSIPIPVTESYPADDTEPAESASPAPMPTHRHPVAVEQEWDQPVPEPAPVWQPFAEPARATEPDRAEPDPALEDPALEDPALEDPATPSSATTSSPTAGPGLVWNDQWQAWLFWDAAHEHWLRHDIDNDRWIPIG